MRLFSVLALPAILCVGAPAWAQADDPAIVPDAQDLSGAWCLETWHDVRFPEHPYDGEMMLSAVGDDAYEGSFDISDQEVYAWADQTVTFQPAGGGLWIAQTEILRGENWLPDTMAFRLEDDRLTGAGLPPCCEVIAEVTLRRGGCFDPIM